MAHLRNVVYIDEARKARQRRGTQQKLLTKAEIAEHFKVSPRTVGRWMQAGMPYERPFEHGSVRFNLPACEAWFRSWGRSA